MSERLQQAPVVDTRAEEPAQIESEERRYRLDANIPPDGPSGEKQYQLGENIPPDGPRSESIPGNIPPIPNNENPNNPESGDVVNQKFIDDIFYGSPNFKQLVRNLSQFGKGKKIIASDGYEYDLEDQTRIIAQLTGSSDPNLGKVTRTFDLRAKVQKLLIISELGI